MNNDRSKLIFRGKKQHTLYNPYKTHSRPYFTSEWKNNQETIKLQEIIKNQEKKLFNLQMQTILLAVANLGIVTYLYLYKSC